MSEPTHYTDVGPHDWAPVTVGSLWQRITGRTITHCEACYLDADEHPVKLWAEARHYGDHTIRRPRYAPYERKAVHRV